MSYPRDSGSEYEECEEGEEEEEEFDELDYREEGQLDRKSVV